jgi:hypothetical protein
MFAANEASKESHVNPSDGNRLKGLNGKDASVRAATMRTKITIQPITYAKDMVGVKASAPDHLVTERFVVGSVSRYAFLVGG